jgi:subtilisin family serine protease
VDASHPVFKDVPMQHHGCAGTSVPDPHGTAVASLMVGRGVEFHGAAAGATLYAADVYCGQATGGSVDLIADALAWLVRERVPVINLSLVGPANAVLEAVVRSAVSRGHLLVAAVGNDGPAAPALYPASYPGVVGVTAVDAHGHALVEAARGPQVSFAAPGADMSAACSPEGYCTVRGTSFAAPLVAGLLASELREPDVDGARAAITALARNARHTGSAQRDLVLGYGLVGSELAPTVQLANAHASQK